MSLMVGFWPFQSARWARSAVMAVEYCRVWCDVAAVAQCVQPSEHGFPSRLRGEVGDGVQQGADVRVDRQGVDGAGRHPARVDAEFGDRPGDVFRQVAGDTAGQPNLSGPTIGCSAGAGEGLGVRLGTEPDGNQLAVGSGDFQACRRGGLVHKPGERGRVEVGGRRQRRHCVIGFGRIDGVLAVVTLVGVESDHGVEMWAGAALHFHHLHE